MPAEAKTVNNQTLKGILSDAAAAMQSVKDCLGRASEATYGYDPEIVRQIRVEQDFLDMLLVQLMQVQTIADDDLFTGAIEALKLQVASLHRLSDEITRIASDIATAPGIGGYMESAVTYIAQALVFISELPSRKGEPDSAERRR